MKKHFQKYPAKFSESCFCLQGHKLKATKKYIFQHGPEMSNELLTKMKRNSNSRKLFIQNYLKTKINLNIF